MHLIRFCIELKVFHFLFYLVHLWRPVSYRTKMMRGSCDASVRFRETTHSLPVALKFVDGIYHLNLIFLLEAITPPVSRKFVDALYQGWHVWFFFCPVSLGCRSKISEIVHLIFPFVNCSSPCHTQVCRCNMRWYIFWFRCLQFVLIPSHAVAPKSANADFAD